MKKVEEFNQRRQNLNNLVLERANLETKRFFSLDHQVYQDGSLSAKNKELIGLVASFVLRCDDCINYHLQQCRQYDVSDEELSEALSIGLIVGGSITIPHLRRATEFWEELKKNEPEPAT